MRPWLPSLFVVLAEAVLAPARAQSLEIAGKMGFLGEWDATAALTRPDNASVYRGPITFRHTGLCSANGPEEKRGELVVDGVGSGHLPQTRLTLEGRECTYQGHLSETVTGFADCRGVQVPIRLWRRPG